MRPDIEVMRAVEAYSPCPSDALATLKFYYQLRPNREEDDGEQFADRMYWEIMCGGDYIRDDEGNIMVEESIQYKKEELDDLFYYAYNAGFVRTMNRMKKLKEELMAAAWHPRRIERILELGGHDALDNFAGL